MMKKLKLIIVLVFVFGTFLGQETEVVSKRFLNIDANLNLMNKTRSYGIIDAETKFASTSYKGGFDASVYYQMNYHQVGVEIFPYLHTNLFYGFDVFTFLNKEMKVKIVPEIKYGYTWDLDKHYSGIGLKLQFGILNLKFNRMLHFKSGSSKYWGDGITGVSLGFTFNRNMIK